MSCCKSVSVWKQIVHQDLLTRIRVHPSRADGNRLDAFWRQFSRVLGHDQVHARFSSRVSYDGGEPADASELDVAALAGHERDFFLGAFADEREERVDGEYVHGEVGFDLRAVS